MTHSNQRPTERSLYDLISAAVESQSEVGIDLAVAAIQSTYVPRKELEALLLGKGAPRDYAERTRYYNSSVRAFTVNTQNEVWRTHIHNVLKGDGDGKTKH